MQRTDTRASASGARRPLPESRIVLSGLVALSWTLLCWQAGVRSLRLDEFLSHELIEGPPRDVVMAAAHDMFERIEP